MAFPKSLPSGFVVKSLATTGQHSSDLNPFQFGIFDYDTATALAPDVAGRKRRLFFAVGSPNNLPKTVGGKFDRLTNQGNVNVSDKSQPVKPSMVDIVYTSKPQKAEVPNVYYLGYNGLHECNTLKFECGKNYRFNVHARGRAVRELMGREFTEVIEVSTGCCGDCDTSCDNAEGCEKYIDQLVSQFNESLWLSKFYTAEKVIHCSPALASLTKTNFTTYCLSICDNGDELALADVQNAYPALKVSVKSRVGSTTTYEFTQLAATAAPANFVQNKTVLQNCASCPSGFTAVAGGFAYIVEIDNANPSGVLAAVQAVWATVTSATLVKFQNGTATYYVISSAALAAPAAGVDAAVVQSLGTVAATCNLTSPTSTAWVSCGTSYKVQRDLCVTVKVDDCDADRDGADAGETLARLTAWAAGVKDFVSGSITLSDSSNCLLSYKLSQYNNDYLTDSCDTEGSPKFDPFPIFEGQSFAVCPCAGWTVDGDGCPQPPVPTDRCCQCGVKFTTNPVRPAEKWGGYDINEYLEKEPIELFVTVYKDDKDTNICSYDTATWFQAQRATFRQLRGDDVIKRIILQRKYENEIWRNPVDKESMLIMKSEGIKFGVDLDAFYYAIDIYHNSPMNTNNTASDNEFREQFTLFINEADYNLFEQVKRQLAVAFPNASFENL